MGCKFAIIIRRFKFGLQPGIMMVIFKCMLLGFKVMKSRAQGLPCWSLERERDYDMIEWGLKFYKNIVTAYCREFR